MAAYIAMDSALCRAKFLGEEGFARYDVRSVSVDGVSRRKVALV
jgi:hypothetical protein